MSQRRWVSVETAAQRLRIPRAVARERALAGEFGQTIPDPVNPISLLVRIDAVEAALGRPASG